ncbi:hypothetical protein [Novosphingobium sp. B 225]|uniref:hypothetical protein n=1 Tax=Novosphingobium sp. B 225 TaxID=1961849 RepID=UPI000B4B1C78|nr:hypothetical protein [Novosphingobium sp. B 225]
MDEFDSAGDDPLVGIDIPGIAQSLGIEHDDAKRGLIALGGAYAEPGDTIASAADATGLQHEVLTGIVEHLGGETGLEQVSQVLMERGWNSG